MNLQDILNQYDSMFGQKSLIEIEEYLVQVIQEAKEKSEWGILVTLLNEIIGFYRDTTQKNKSLACCSELLDVLKIMKLEGRIDYATSLLNIANAYRAFGLFRESLQLYQTVEEIYLNQIPENDFMYASLYNNWSLLYQETEEFEKAKEMLVKALVIADYYEDAIIPQATTRTNLAATLLQIGTEEAYQEAVKYLQEALSVHEKNGGKDFHYGAVLTAMGDAYSWKEDFEKAAEYYEKSLLEIEKHVGKTDNYERVLEKYSYVKAQMKSDIAESVIREEKESAYHNDAQEKGTKWISNLECSRAFYETYGKEMIHKKFPEYEDRIAVGLIGEGSDCFAFDDVISTDHDYEVGFCMWLTEHDYQEIGNELQKEYEDLIKRYIEPNSNHVFLNKRRGVFSINSFYNNLLGTGIDFEKECDSWTEGIIDYERVSESQLATATNGILFCDRLGIFGTVRMELSSYYPKDIWRRKLAQSMHDFSQYAQSNYARMMARGDKITAHLCISKAMEAAMDMVYLLKHTYAPYYKWKRKGLEKLAMQEREQILAATILPLLDELVMLPIQENAWLEEEYSPIVINVKDECVILFEKIAALIVEELNQKNLVIGKNTFLEGYIGQILCAENVEESILLDKKTLTESEEKEYRMNFVEKIVELEWKQFDKVQNEGGRAGCQDDYETFCIMRKSQYLSWTDELLNSYYNDLVTAENKGWNLIMEKYARMMKSTTPEKYAELEKELPVRGEERLTIQEELIQIQVGWMEEFANQYPNMAGNARSIHSSEDTPFNTSYETYLRGELGTYSEETFILYGRFIVGLVKENRNLAYEIMQNTAQLYGYDSIEAVEAKL